MHKYSSNEWICEIFDSNNQFIIFLVDDKEFLKKHNETQDEISNLFKKVLDSEPVCNDKYTKTKIKLYNNRINKSFQGN